MLLYDHPLSPYAQKCRIALREKGIAFEARLPGALGTSDIEPEFAAASPRAEVPALVDGDLRIFDSTIILEYIEERWPEPPLLPDDPAERARLRMLEDVMDTHFEAITWGLAELRFFGRAEGQRAEAMVAEAGRQLAGWLAWLERELADRPWFNGPSFGWGDLCVVPFLNGAAGFGHRPSGRLEAWWTRANERPSVAEWARSAAAASFEGSSLGLERVREALEKGLFKREYRDHRLEWMLRSGGADIVLEGMRRGTIRFSHELS
jgi:glutathione S-transferase/RNA polymerase-associated protein